MPKTFMPSIKPLAYTLHANAKLHERGIRPEWVEQAVRHPLWAEPEPRDPTAERRFAPIPDFGGRVLRVVCVETEAAIRVITATFDRGARNRR